jgi:hypothetical protein
MRKFRDNRDWRRVGDKLGKMLVNCIKNNNKISFLVDETGYKVGLYRPRQLQDANIGGIPNMF